MSNAAMVYLSRILWGMPATPKGCSEPGTNGQELPWTLIRPNWTILNVDADRLTPM